VTFTRTVTPLGGVADPRDPVHKTYWEAWHVDSGTGISDAVHYDPGTFSVDNASPPSDRDKSAPTSTSDQWFSSPFKKPSSGTVEWHATAYFYPNLELPASFKINGEPLSHGLPSTDQDPGLPAPPQGEDGVERDLTVSWDSVKGTVEKRSVKQDDENGNLADYEMGVEVK
jgi:hypothetical protein